MTVDPKEKIADIIATNPTVISVFKSFGVSNIEEYKEKTVEEVIAENSINFISLFNELNKIPSQFVTPSTADRINSGHKHLQRTCEICHKKDSNSQELFLFYQPEKQFFRVVKLRRCSACKNGGIAYWTLIIMTIIIALSIFFLICTSFDEMGFRTKIVLSSLIPLAVGYPIIKFLIPIIVVKNPTSFLKIQEIEKLLSNGYILSYIGDVKKEQKGCLLRTQKGLYYSPNDVFNDRTIGYSFSQGFRGPSEKIYKADIEWKISIKNALVKVK